LFQNMGEGTYYHSGYLAIRQAIAARTNVTYKILFNDAVAMTGGQPVDGPISVAQIVRQVLSEGAAKVAVVTDEPDRYAGRPIEAGVAVRDRRDLDLVQRELRGIEGVTILIYDQTCAAEKRRRRKKGTFPDPSRRMLINSDVCEGCGDCGRASNCLSILPLETELGRKRTIDQTSCNKDFSCVEGFCPSFVSVIGGTLRRAEAARRDWSREAEGLAPPPMPRLRARPHNLLIAGVGGTGIITAGAVVAMAAHLDGLAVSELDFTALAQKGGSVMCHLRMAAAGMRINQPRIDWGEAQAVIMADLIVGCLPDSLGTIRRGTTRVLANTHIGSTAEFTRNPDADPHASDLLAKVRHAAGAASLTTLDANAAALAWFGDATTMNMMLIGHAWQQGLIPISETALLQAITLNGIAVTANKRAFACGRMIAAKGLDNPGAASSAVPPDDYASIVADRVGRLTQYQSAAYAERYERFLQSVADAERRAVGKTCDLSFAKAVARSLYKLMAYKDEYEVARLHTRTDFLDGLRRQFDGAYSLRFHLAPPGLAKRREGKSVPEKLTFGPWMRHVLALLARLCWLRGTPFDPFGRTAERRMERRLIDDYQALILDLLRDLSPRTHGVAIRLAALPEQMRGFGHVKLASIESAKAEEARLLAEFGRLARPEPEAVREVA
jgi:indolepyruvate ferredoxin oxidoreductase